MYSLRVPTALILFCVFCITACKTDKKPTAIDPAFAGYISAFTSGVISNQSTVKIRLTEPGKNAVAGQAIKEKLLSFKPEIDGELFWADEQTIEFKPSKQLPSGKLYEAKFYLSKVTEVPEKLQTLTFHFQILQQSMEVEFDGIDAHDRNNLKWQKMFGSAMTYDYAEATSVENSLVALQNGKELKILWEHKPDGRIHKFTIDSIQRTESRGQIILQWSGKHIGFKGEFERVFEIPPLGEFMVLDVITTQHPEQYITVHFSDPVNTDQDLEGLFYLQPGSALRLVREVNSVKLYPASRLNGTIKFTVAEGIRNSMGYQLVSGYEKSLSFTSLKPAIELIGKGNILPSTNGLIFPFKAVNLSAVSVKVIKVFENNVAQFLQVNRMDGDQELKRVGRILYKGDVILKSDKPVDYGNWNTFSIDLSKLIQAEPGAMYRVHLSFNQQQSLYPCDDVKSDNQTLTPFKEDNEDSGYDGPSNNWYYYDEDEDYYYENYNYQERDNPCKSSYYMANRRSVARNILASDLGIIAKSGQGTNMLIAITDLRTTAPLSGVKVDIYNFQNQLIKSDVTGSDGFLEIDLQKKPFLLVAAKDKQRGYLRLDDGSALSLSMFDVGGQQLVKGVKGFIYGERGVWRPGDSLYVSFILEDKNKLLPENHPAIFELYTPQQQLHERKVRNNPVNGFYDFRTVTSPDAPTGNWTAKVKIGGSVFTRVIKIETVKPNRLKLNLDFKTPFLSNVSKPVGELEVKWLHGAVAGNLKADVELSLTKGSTLFKQYEGYVFDDPAKDFSQDEKMIFEGKVDQNGKATITPDIQIQSNAPGMLMANFRIRAFEMGGDFSVDRFSVPYSPYRGYVGIKIPEGKGWNGALFSNEPNLFPIITVDEKGNPVDRKGLIIEIFDVYWRWWWERASEDDLSRYVTNSTKNLLKKTTIDTKNGKAVYEMNLGGDYYGRKFIRVTDPETGHSTGQTFYVTYKGWWNNDGGENPGGAELLTFTTDKKSYLVGDKIKVNIPSAQQGRTLVSIESGSRMIQKFWMDMSEGENNFELDATPEMAPNIYLNLTLIQPHKNTINDLPIRLYGIQPVRIENPESKLEPVIAMPEVLMPEKKFTVNVSEKSGRKMTYTLAVVDEGLLDLTRFKTPDPYSYFYSKEALSVRTWDMYKYVIGAFSGEMAGLLALGGDEFAVKDGGVKANRFKPVVSFLGPFELTANGSNKHIIEMPNYIGSVRTMVIAGEASAYGSAEKTSAVKKPLMTLATLPRVLGPGEKVNLPVTVFAMDKKIKSVSVTIESNNLLLVDGTASKTINFTQEGDQVVNFSLRVADKTGIAKLKVIAKSGNEQATHEIELDVRTPNPRITDVISALIEPGESWESEYKPIGITGTNKGVVEISTLPPLKLQERLEYLIRYPHGCVEQITSSVFPQLYLSNLLDLPVEAKQQTEENIKEAISKLRNFQIYSGGISYWPGENDVASDWGTNYVGHFMIEAQSKGYALPPGFLSNWIKFQSQRAESWTPDMESRGYGQSSHLIQAYRLYTLALAKAPAIGAMNRLRSQNNLSLAARWRLAAAYALMGKNEIAQNLIANLSSDIKPYKELSYSFGSAERDKAMILETLTILGRKKDAKVILDELASEMASNRWYSTQTTAYTLLAIAKFVGNAGDKNEQMKYGYSVNNETIKPFASSAPMSQHDLKIINASPGKIKINNTGSKTLYINLILQGIPSEDKVMNAENNLGISVTYLSADGVPIDPAVIKQGTDFIAQVQITHPGLRDDYKEMALTQIFPSGWEIRNMRMDGVASSNLADQPTYEDIRDDRVMTYFDIERGKKKTFRVLLNASYTGEYFLPTVNCEAMYDNQINARRSGRWVRVTGQ